MSSVRSKAHPPASTPGKVAAGLFLVVGAFQFALAAGAPWGAAALGGANPGVLPDELRVSSAVQGALYLMLAGIAGTRWTSTTVRRRMLYGMTALMAVGAVMNIATPSFVERMLWAPVTIALVIALWFASRHASLSPGSRSPLGPAARAI